MLNPTYESDMRRAVTKTELKKIERETFEMRSLYCWITKDTRVSISLDHNVRAKTAGRKSRPALRAQLVRKHNERSM